MNIRQTLIDHLGWIQRKARTYYTDVNDAADLAGETISKCLRFANRFNPAMSFKPWAIAIMENTFITQYNRRKKVLFTDYKGNIEKVPSDEHADSLATVGNILDIIRECSRKTCCMECVMLYAYGYTYEEIADMMGLKLGTVKSRVFMGRKLLRETLDY